MDDQAPMVSRTTSIRNQPTIRTQMEPSSSMQSVTTRSPLRSRRPFTFSFQPSPPVVKRQRCVRQTSSSPTTTPSPARCDHWCGQRASITHGVPAIERQTTMSSLPIVTPTMPPGGRSEAHIRTQPSPELFTGSDVEVPRDRYGRPEHSNYSSEQQQPEAGVPDKSIRYGKASEQRNHIGFLKERENFILNDKK